MIDDHHHLLEVSCLELRLDFLLALNHDHDRHHDDDRGLGQLECLVAQL
jgi:hypothetical protein